MAVAERVPVSPAVMVWARRTSGLDVETAAKRLQVHDEKVTAWESGVASPTINQLRRLARLYKRPLVVMLLPEPPRDFQALQDFRRTGGGVGSTWSPALHAELKRAVSQREVILEPRSRQSRRVCAWELFVKVQGGLDRAGTAPMILRLSTPSDHTVEYRAR
ncbi:MAG TPA: helix-turn-helix transcriptional regulator, partial [Micromonosporaceae bacterium]|nr:helix-turn-helix transcriptional regulator [Micromonosporaceae bacterium]